NQNNFLINISVLYRYTQKYFDRHLAQYGIGSGQMIFLLLINEHEGITMQQLTLIADFDKGTTTKNLQRLVEQDYITIQTDDADKRVKRLYTTKKTRDIINNLYEIRNECCNQLMNGLDNEAVEKQMQLMTDNAHDIAPEESYNQLRLGGLQKLTLLDYPGHVSCTVFTAGCNMKCPFCHNRDLVFIPENFEFMNPESVFDLLRKRQGTLDAVAITGGEQLLQKGLKDFIIEIRNLGFKVKLDTNGYYPEKLKELIDEGLIDYVAMDIKAPLAKYPATVGLPEINFKADQIRKTIKYLMSDVVDYEFRTTVVRELHTKEDMAAIGKMIKGCKHYYLQQFVDSGRCIEQGYTSYTKEEMSELRDEVAKYVPVVELRGVK
ncbi:MAG: anaerobic ribonucleoside-triphosphate reductase activating protein, partial [Erysipelotrichaceae bacterium]|nr:anaerobic ribonucleoside-triphosphate reductase activating protein [Erysipelotrichaceae bacterium]